MSYMVDKSPVEDTIMQRQLRPWEPKKHVPVMTASRSAFKTYNTYVALQASMARAHGGLTWLLQDEEQIPAVDTGGSAQVMMARNRRSELVCSPLLLVQPCMQAPFHTSCSTTTM